MTGVSSDLRAGSQTREQSIAVGSVTQLCAPCFKVHDTVGGPNYGVVYSSSRTPPQQHENAPYIYICTLS